MEGIYKGQHVSIVDTYTSEKDTSIKFLIQFSDGNLKIVPSYQCELVVESVSL
jgi:hypothetical protein